MSGDALSKAILHQHPELAGHVHYVDGRPWCDGVNHTTRCRADRIGEPEPSHYCRACGVRVVTEGHNANDPD